MHHECEGQDSSAHQAKLSPSCVPHSAAALPPTPACSNSILNSFSFSVTNVSAGQDLRIARCQTACAGMQKCSCASKLKSKHVTLHLVVHRRAASMFCNNVAPHGLKRQPCVYNALSLLVHQLKGWPTPYMASFSHRQATSVADTSKCPLRRTASRCMVTQRARRVFCAQGG